MKFFKWSADGGKDSGVKGLFIIEIKSLFSIVLLKFNPGGREAFHSHAFNAVTWWLKGFVVEERLHPEQILPNGGLLVRMQGFSPSFKPKVTLRHNLHRVESAGTTWAISFRGPWKDTWQEYRPGRGLVTLTHGRKVIE